MRADPVSLPNHVADGLDYSTMAESRADVFGKDATPAKLLNRRMGIFDVDALRCFGDYSVRSQSGAVGDELSETIQRLSALPSRDLYRFGFRPAARGTCENPLLLQAPGRFPRYVKRERIYPMGDFRAKSRGDLEVYRPSGAMLSRKAHRAESEFRDMPIDRSCL